MSRGLPNIAGTSFLDVIILMVLRLLYLAINHSCLGYMAKIAGCIYRKD